MHDKTIYETPGEMYHDAESFRRAGHRLVDEISGVNGGAPKRHSGVESEISLPCRFTPSTTEQLTEAFTNAAADALDDLVARGVLGFLRRLLGDVLDETTVFLLLSGLLGLGSVRRR